MLEDVELRNSRSRNMLYDTTAHGYFTKPTALPVIRLRDQITSDPDSVLDVWTHATTIRG